MSLGEHELRYCRQCRKNMPVEDFINRTKNGYCIVCKTCRDRQLRRYYEKKDELERYPYEEKDIGNKKAAVPTKKESSHTDSPSAPSSPNTVGENDLPFTSPLLKSKRIITLPFLLPRYAVVSSASSTRDRMAGIYLAKVLYHRTYHLNQVRQHL